MKELDNYAHYFAQIFVSIKKGFTSITGLVTLLSSFIIALNGIQRAILALMLVFFLDLITGCIASWVEHRKNENRIKVYFFESSKMRLSVVKAISYMMLILFAWLLAGLFFDLPIGLTGSSKQFTVVELTTGACIAIEVWSNIENLKRAGFDVLGKAKSIIKQVYNFKDLLKTGKESQA